MKYVIIGNSAAAIGCVEAIRKNDAEGNITIISNENYHTYSRPLISYFVMGNVNEDNMKYRDNSFYKLNKCIVMLGKTVVKIDNVKKYIYLDDGEAINYDKLLVATGSSPFVPPINGLFKVERKYTFTSFDDAILLKENLKDKPTVLILGAGLIGLKCAEGISRLSKCICVDLSPKVLSSILDDEGSEMIKKKLEENNITFFLNKQVSELTENSAILNDGTVIDFDILVIAVGVRPNISLINDIGGKTNRGILIDERCKTSLPDIYAAGDCCESTDVSSGESKVMALLPNAYMQGECAGFNMAGKDFEFNKAIPMNAIGFFGTHILTAGNYNGDVYIESDGKNYKKLYYSDNKLNGYILIGNIEKAGIYTALIREKTPLDSIDFALVSKTPGLMAFSKEDRAYMLGGIKDGIKSL